MSQSEPGPGYIYLTSLVLEGFFHTFITTNFDDLIHDVLFRYGGLKPAVAAFDSQVSSLRPQSPRPKIIKVHGDFLYNNIRNVGPEVGRLDKNMEEKFERTCENYGLIVLGYSGQDNSVMAPLRGLLHRSDRLTHGLHWCVYCPKGQERAFEREIPEELYFMWERYPEKVHLYDVRGFDDVMEAFYLGCGCEPPPELKYPEQKALYSRLRDGLENADQTWRLSHEFSSLLGLFRKAKANPPPIVSDKLDKADYKHREGGRKIDEGKFQEAIAAFEEAVDIAESALEEADRLIKKRSPDADAYDRVRAYRRLGGSRCNVVEAMLSEKKLNSAAELASAELVEVKLRVLKSLKWIRSGIEVDQKISSPPGLRGHRINLWFNGLICYVYLLQIDPRFLKRTEMKLCLGSTA